MNIAVIMWTFDGVVGAVFCAAVLVCIVGYVIVMAYYKLIEWMKKAMRVSRRGAEAQRETTGRDADHGEHGNRQDADNAKDSNGDRP